MQGLRKGTVSVFAKYNGKVLKRYNVTVTSDWQEYLGYVSWRKGIESQIWNNSMNVTQKLDAAKSYLKSNYRYGSSGLKVYAYKSGSLDCISASQIWNNSMNVTQKLDAAKSYLKSNYRYGSSGLKVYAYKSGSLDCISASDIFGDIAKDLGLQVKYYNERIGKAFDYIVESYSVSDGHIYNLVMIDGQWVRYDASPMP